MSDFTAKMHQIQFRLGLCPRSRWWSYSAPTRLPSWRDGTGCSSQQPHSRSRSV